MLRKQELEDVVVKIIKVKDNIAGNRGERDRLEDWYKTKLAERSKVDDVVIPDKSSILTRIQQL